MMQHEAVIWNARPMPVHCKHSINPSPVVCFLTQSWVLWCPDHPLERCSIHMCVIVCWVSTMRREELNVHSMEVSWITLGTEHQSGGHWNCFACYQRDKWNRSPWGPLCLVPKALCLEWVGHNFPWGQTDGLGNQNISACKFRIALGTQSQ